MTGLVFVVSRRPRNRHFVILSVLSVVMKEMKCFQALILINIFKLSWAVPGPLQPAQPHEFPFQVSIGSHNSHYCSGALLNKVSCEFDFVQVLVLFFAEKCCDYSKLLPNVANSRSASICWSI